MTSIVESSSCIHTYTKIIIINPRERKRDRIRNKPCFIHRCILINIYNVYTIAVSSEMDEIFRNLRPDSSQQKHAQYDVDFDSQFANFEVQRMEKFPKSTCVTSSTNRRSFYVFLVFS